jgi:hypothetical protein
VGKKQLIASIMSCEIIDEGEFDLHLRRKDDLNYVKGIV